MHWLVLRDTNATMHLVCHRYRRWCLVVLSSSGSSLGMQADRWKNGPQRSIRVHAESPKHPFLPIIKWNKTIAMDSWSPSRGKGGWACVSGWHPSPSISSFLALSLSLLLYYIQYLPTVSRGKSSSASHRVSSSLQSHMWKTLDS